MLACRNRGSAADGPKIQSRLQHRGSLNQNQETFEKKKVFLCSSAVALCACHFCRKEGWKQHNQHGPQRCEVVLALHLHDGHAVGAKTRALVQLSNWGRL